MNDKIGNKILAKIKRARKCKFFFSNDFSEFGSVPTIRTALKRLVNAGNLECVASGIFTRPQTNIRCDIVSLMDGIANAIARRKKAKIVSTGAFALFKLGLFAQAPMKIVYLTNGPTRNVKIGNHTISLVKTLPKNVNAMGKISRLAIQALKSIGKKNVSQNEIKQIQNALLKEKISYLEHDISISPSWIQKIMERPLMKIQKTTIFL